MRFRARSVCEELKDNGAQMDNSGFSAEFLRQPVNTLRPDPRSVSFVKYDASVRGMRPLKLEDHYEAMCDLVLHPGVSQDVTIQFETAKNLYLYAWFVYRFFAAAEHVSLTCLELGLRERFGEDLPKKYIGRGGRPTLRPLLRYARDYGFMKNEGFRRWHERAQRRAEYRYSEEKSKEMRVRGLESIDLDYSEAVVTDEDRNWNLIEILVETLPETRNHYAHGTSSIHNQVRGTLELVLETLNQVFLPPITK